MSSQSANAMKRCFAACWDAVDGMGGFALFRTAVAGAADPRRQATV